MQNFYNLAVENGYDRPFLEIKKKVFYRYSASTVVEQRCFPVFWVLNFVHLNLDCKLQAVRRKFASILY